MLTESFHKLYLNIKTIAVYRCNAENRQNIFDRLEWFFVYIVDLFIVSFLESV
jgi:hypothetical protein